MSGANFLQRNLRGKMRFFRASGGSLLGKMKGGCDVGRA